jgi:hypothetical protein
VLCRGRTGIAEPSSRLNKIQIVIGEKVISIDLKASLTGRNHISGFMF